MLSLILGLSLCLPMHVSADTTLYIPGADEQPLSVQQLGIDGNGRTSWVIGPGTPTGTFTDPNVQFTATLVEGPSDAILRGSIPGGPAFSYSCAIAGSQASCQLIASDETLIETTTIMEVVSPFVVQGGGSASSALNSSPPSSTLTPPPTNTPSLLSPTFTVPASSPNLPLQSTNSARSWSFHMSWVWLVLIHAFHNVA